jgi:hypothetical protein
MCIQWCFNVVRRLHIREDMQIGVDRQLVACTLCKMLSLSDSTIEGGSVSIFAVIMIN